MLATLLKLSAEVKVVDVTGKTAGVFHFLACPVLCAFVSVPSCERQPFSFFSSPQLVPAPSCWSRQPDYRTSATLWTNSRWRVGSHLLSPLCQQTDDYKSKRSTLFLFQGEVAEHVVSYQPGAKASSDFATFPVSSFVKVKPASSKSSTFRLFLEVFTLTCHIRVSQAKEEKQGGTMFVGRVAIPCTPGQEQVHRLVLSQQQLQKVHHLLMT